MPTPMEVGQFGEQDQENEEGKARTPDQHYPTLTHDEVPMPAFGCSINPTLERTKSPSYSL
jgi:hypothetical protein